MNIKFRKQEKEYVHYLMKSQNSKGLLQYFYRYILHRLSLKAHIQIPFTCKIGKNFKIHHLGRVIVNPGATLGDDVLVNPGVVIGQENRGKRIGCPTIGNRVWIGANAVIVGNVVIGDDVLIAPNAFVNIDVPSHSVVVGNPAIIKHKNKATEGYLK